MCTGRRHTTSDFPLTALFHSEHATVKGKHTRAPFKLVFTHGDWKLHHLGDIKFMLSWLIDCCIKEVIWIRIRTVCPLWVLQPELHENNLGNWKHFLIFYLKLFLLRRTVVTEKNSKDKTVMQVKGWRFKRIAISVISAFNSPAPIRPTGNQWLIFKLTAALFWCSCGRRPSHGHCISRTLSEVVWCVIGWRAVSEEHTRLHLPWSDQLSRPAVSGQS